MAVRSNSRKLQGNCGQIILQPLCKSASNARIRLYRNSREKTTLLNYGKYGIYNGGRAPKQHKIGNLQQQRRRIEHDLRAVISMFALLIGSWNSTGSLRVPESQNAMIFLLAVQLAYILVSDSRMGGKRCVGRVTISRSQDLAL